MILEERNKKEENFKRKRIEIVRNRQEWLYK